MLKGIVSDEILSTALVGPDGRTAIGVNQNLLAPHLSPGKNLDKVRQLDSQTSLQTCSGLYSGFGMAALISNKALMDQIGKVFSRTYLVLRLISPSAVWPRKSWRTLIRSRAISSSWMWPFPPLLRKTEICRRK